jgi:hypothetical protein
MEINGRISLDDQAPRISVRTLLKNIVHQQGFYRHLLKTKTTHESFL